ncbi:MAG: GCN5-related N-acetyltransferase [Bacillales bacterium]|jgi:RimJ/RimL family protein N-acetyltransferase|nr:GCN5-related N-acetyltransferase [Bacillales bacterium]
MIETTFTINTERLVLRPLSLSDLDTVHKYASDIENTSYMLNLPNDSVQETEQFLQRIVEEWNKDVPSFYELAIVLNGIHIGAVSVSLDESRQEGELGWIINKAYQGNGYATEAAKAIFNFALNNLKVKKVVAHCDCRNEPSIKVMDKIGLTLERDDGIRPYKENNEIIKELMYSFTVDNE